MQKNNTVYPNLKQIEQLVWRQLQETFSKVMKTLLEDLDKQIAEERNKKRYRLLDKRTTKNSHYFTFLRTLQLFDNIFKKSFSEIISIP